MRNLVVAVDPLSNEQPDTILDDWSKHTDMTIIKWSDTDYMPTQFMQSKRPPDEYLIKDTAMEDRIEISNHRYRQRIFLSSCMKHFRLKRNSSWLMHVDTDEFIVPFDQQEPHMQSVEKQGARRRNKNTTLPLSTATSSKIPLAAIPGSTLHYIQKNLQRSTNVVRYPCIGMPRRLFGSVERQTDTGTSASTKHAQLDPAKFETLRWAYHVPLDANENPSKKETKPYNGLDSVSGMGKNGYPKVILDISAIPERYFTNPHKPVFSIHRPFLDLCPRSTEVYATIGNDSTTKKTTRNRRQQQVTSQHQKVPFLGVNHYLGSWERYSRKDDKRRSKLVYDYKNQQATAMNVYDNDTQPWLDGFIKSVSQETAAQLLRTYR
jgi:Glycosyltransferase family 92